MAIKETAEVVVAVAVMVVAVAEEDMEHQHPLTLEAVVDTAAEVVEVVVTAVAAVVAVTAVAVVEEVAMAVDRPHVMARGTLLAEGRAKTKTRRAGHQFANIFLQSMITYCYLTR